mmetsp:Transcript_8790/g.10201  ORF Transcript_8790/g.10201 Transcript_8790/m.10201 type:complete len:568 (+) Transcript_8790:39-1742(+)
MASKLLHSIFPDWDTEDLNRVLQHFDGNTENTINTILAHIDDGGDAADLFPIEPDNRQLDLLVTMFRNDTETDDSGRTRWTRGRLAAVYHRLDDDISRTIDAVLQHERLPEDSQLGFTESLLAGGPATKDGTHIPNLTTDTSFDVKSDDSKTALIEESNFATPKSAISKESDQENLKSNEWVNFDIGNEFSPPSLATKAFLNSGDEPSKRPNKISFVGSFSPYENEGSIVEEKITVGIPIEDDPVPEESINIFTFYKEWCCSSENKKYWKYGTIVILITAISLLAASLRQIKSIQYGVEYDTWAKTLDDGVQQAGLFLGPIGYRFIRFPSIQIQNTVEDTCVSRDGLRIEFSASYQYKLKKDMILDAILSFRDYETWKDFTDTAANSGIQTACSDWGVTDFQIKWQSVQNSMFLEVQKKLQGDENNDNHDGMYAEAIALQLTMVKFPEEYMYAVRKKQAAKEDVALAIQQRIQETIRARTGLLVAEREAEILMDRAYNTANVTLTQAGYTADQTKFMFDRESMVLSQAKSFLSLDANGVLGFMSNQLYEKVPALRTRMTAPAVVSQG